MNSKDFVNLYESYYEFMEAEKILGEEFVAPNGKVYKNKNAYRSTMRNARLKQERETSSSYEDMLRLRSKRLSTILKDIFEKNGLIHKSSDYQENKQVANYATVDLEHEYPEVFEQILQAMQNSGLTDDDALKVLYNLFGAYADRKHSNFSNSKQRQENREPDDPFEQQRKANNKLSADKSMDATITQLKEIPENDISQFLTVLGDAVVDYDFKRFKKKLINLQNEIPQESVKQKYIAKALANINEIKRRGMKLED